MIWKEWIWKEWIFMWIWHKLSLLCVLNWIVGKYLQFERYVQENYFDWIKLQGDYTIWKEWFLCGMDQIVGKIPTIWKIWI